MLEYEKACIMLKKFNNDAYSLFMDMDLVMDVNENDVNGEVTLWKIKTMHVFYIVIVKLT